FFGLSVVLFALPRKEFLIPRNRYTSRPIIIQQTKRIQVSNGRNAIIPKHTRIPRTGTSGTKGVRNARGASGWVFLRTSTPTHTRMNANSVPILVISPTTLPGMKAANRLTKTRKKRLDFQGVRYFG